MPQPPSPIMPASLTPQLPRESSKLPAVLAVLGVVALLAGGVVFAARQGYIQLPFQLPFLSKAPTLGEVAAKLESLTSAKISTEVAVAVVPREAGVEPVALPEPKAPEEGAALGLSPAPPVTNRVLGSLPGDLQVNSKLVTSWSRSNEKQHADAEISGNFSSQGLSAVFEAAWRTTDSGSYLRLGKMPVLLFDLTPVTGTWIKLPAGQGLSFDLTSLAGGGDESTIVLKSAADLEDEAKKETEDDKAGKKSSPLDEFRALFAAATRNGALTAANVDGKASVNGRPAWGLELALDVDKMRQAVQEVYDRRQELFPGVEKFTLFDKPPEAMTAEESQQAKAVLAQAKLTVFVDKKTAMPVQLSFRLRVAPSEKDAPKLKDKQVNISLTVSLDKVNEAVVVEEPGGAITMKQAIGKLMGGSTADMLAAEQGQILEDLQAALEQYRKKNGNYPAKLADLVGFEFDPRSDAAVARAAGDAKSYLMRVVNIPNDAFSGQPFVYAVAGDDYELKYQMTFSDDLSQEVKDEVVDGTNTMTSTVMSREAPLAVSDDDSDWDGLTNVAEKTLGTDPNKADTDGDGFSDKQEVDGGFDPLTNSQTGEKATVIAEPEPVAVGRPSSDSNDPLRVSLIKQIQTAAELYFADHNGYPSGSKLIIGGPGAKALCDTGFSGTACSSGGVTYYRTLEATPEPPGGPCTAEENDFTYTQTDGGAGYELTFCLGGRVGDLMAGPHIVNPNGVD